MAWRDHNETPEDLAREEAARVEIEKLWACGAMKLSPTLYAFDWALYRGEDEVVLAVAEFKHRTVPWGRYPDALLSSAKAEQIKRFAREHGVVGFYIMRWSDGALRYCKVEDHEPGIRIGGSDRGQNGDKEPCVRYLLKRFKVLGRG